jgi:hypothetical protein
MSNAGNDNAAGSITAPWASLNKANSTMTAGDTLYLRGGTYSGVSGINWSKSGTVNNPVVISAYPGEHPVFNGNGADWLLMITGSYAVFDGFEVTNYHSWAFMPDGGAHVLEFRSCYIHDILAVEVGGITTKSCYQVVIENCIFERMGRSLTQTAYDHALYNAAGSHDIIIRNNLFRDNYAGPAIHNYHTPSPYNIWIYNNVFLMRLGAERSGIFTGNGTNHVYVYNNTFYASGAGAYHCSAFLFNSGQGTNVAVNNIIYFDNWDNNDAILPANGDTIDYNLYFPKKDGDDPGAHSFVADPQFVNLAKADLHLSATSPAIDKGKNLNLVFDYDYDRVPRPQGKSFDVGAYEQAASVGVKQAAAPYNGRNLSLAISGMARDGQIGFALCGAGEAWRGTNARLAIFDCSGALIQALDMPQGRVVWNLFAVPNGSFIANVTYGSGSICRRVVLMR